MSGDIEQRMILGREAGRLLEDPLFNGILNVITKDNISILMKADPGSNEAMAAHSDLKAMDRIKQQLTAIKNDGAMARKEAER